MATEWYIKSNDEIRGPFDSPKMKKLGRTGNISSGDLVRKGADGDWVSVLKLRGLEIKNVVLKKPRSTDESPPLMGGPPPLAQKQVEADPATSASIESSRVDEKDKASNQGLMSAPTKLWLRFLLASRWGLREIKEVITATLGQGVRLGLWPFAEWALWNTRRKEVDAKHSLGEHLFGAELGDPALRDQLNKLNEQIGNPKSNWFDRRRLNRQKKRAVIRLANQPYDRAKLSAALQQYEDQVATSQKAVEQGRQTAEENRRALWPVEAPDQLRVLTGVGAMTVVSIAFVVLFGSRPDGGSINGRSAYIQENGSDIAGLPMTWPNVQLNNLA